MYQPVSKWWRYLDNQQEFRVNKTDIAKISVKAKNGSSDYYLAGERQVHEKH